MRDPRYNLTAPLPALQGEAAVELMNSGRMIVRAEELIYRKREYQVHLYYVLNAGRWECERYQGSSSGIFKDGYQGYAPDAPPTAKKFIQEKVDQGIEDFTQRSSELARLLLELEIYHAKNRWTSEQHHVEQLQKELKEKKETRDAAGEEYHALYDSYEMRYRTTPHNPQI